MTQKYITNIHPKLKKYQIKPTLLQIFSPKQTFFYCLLQPSLYLSTTKWQTNRFDYQQIKTQTKFFDEEEHWLISKRLNRINNWESHTSSQTDFVWLLFFCVKTCQKRRVFWKNILTKAFWGYYICGNNKSDKTATLSEKLCNNFGVLLTKILFVWLTI